MGVAGVIQKNAPSPTNPNTDNDYVDPHIGMEFNLANNVYNFYNECVRRVGFEITTMYNRSNNKKEIYFKYLTC